MPGLEPKYKKRVTLHKKALNGIRGFSSVEGSLFFFPAVKKVKILLRFVAANGNLGPIPLFTETWDWVQAPDFAKMRLFTETRMEEVIADLKAGIYPPMGVQLDRCNTLEDPEFITKVCVKCSCPYCELSTIP